MTTRKTFKHRVRARMEKTGERYTAARRNVAAAASSTTATAKPPSSAPPRSPTRRSARRRDWTGTSGSRSLTMSARPVGSTQTSPAGWFPSTGSRAGGRRASRSASSGRAGCAQSASDRRGSRSARRRPSTSRSNGCTRRSPMRNAQRLAGARGPRPLVDGTADHQPRLGDGSRVGARFTAQGPAKSQVALQQDPLPDASAVEELRAFWRPRLADLKSVSRRAAPLARPAPAPASLLDAGATTSRHPTRCAAILLGMSEPRAEEPTRIRVGQAAEMLGITVETLRRWETEGRLTMERSEGGSGSSRSRRSRGSSRSGDARRPRGRSSRSLRATTSRAS